jgi:hypothetical protein
MKNVKKCGGGGGGKPKLLAKGLRLLALIAVIGFSMAACDDDPGDVGGGINGNWRHSNGMQVNISGSTGTIRVMGSPSASSWQDAISKGYIRNGTEYFRSITRTDNYSWSGEILRVNRSGSSTATGTSYRSCTFSLSYNGQTLTVYSSDSSGSTTETWSRY